MAIDDLNKHDNASSVLSLDLQHCIVRNKLLKVPDELMEVSFKVANY